MRPNLPADQYKARYGVLRPPLFVRVQGKGEDYAEAVRERLQREMPGDPYIRARSLRDALEPEQQSWKAGATMFLVSHRSRSCSRPSVSAA